MKDGLITNFVFFLIGLFLATFIINMVLGLIGVTSILIKLSVYSVTAILGWFWNKGFAVGILVEIVFVGLAEFTSVNVPFF